MVFNPVYIQKSNDGETQSFGNGFANQKPSYLFSDIIKVILAKVDQPVDASGQVNGGESGNNAEAAASENPLLISDAEVELFEKLVKINFANINSDSLKNEKLPDVQVVLDNLKMYLKGLTNQEESTAKETKSFEIDKSDLLVVLNIVAGNIYDKTNIAGGENDFTSELKGFIKEVESYIQQLKGKTDQKLVVQQNDFTIEFKPLKNGKIAVELVDQKENKTVETPETKVQTSELTDVQGKEVTTDKTKQSTVKTAQAVPVENADNAKKKVNTANEKPELNIQIPQDKKVETKENQVKIDVVTKDAVQPEKDNQKPDTVKLNTAEKVAENEPKVSAKDGKEVIKIINENPQVKTKSNGENVKVVSNEKPVEGKEFFNGKIKIEVVNVNQDSNRKSALVKPDAVKADVVKTDAVKSDNFTDVQSKVVNSQSTEIAANQTNKTTADVPKLKNVVDNQPVKNVEVSGNENVKEQAQTVTKNPANTKADSNTILKKETAENSQADQKITTLKEEKPVSIHNTSSSVKDVKTGDVKTDSTNTVNQNQTAEYAAVDKKSTNDNVNKNNLDSERTTISKEKSVKAVTSNKETDNQKPDSQNQNSFDRSSVNMNKLNQYGREVKETVRVIDQSRLMSEIENTIKNGDRKVVKLNLSPEDLGSVKISLDVNDKIVTAKINVTTDAAKQIILTQADSLKSSLTQSGIQLASLNVSVNNSDDKGPQQGKMKRKGSSVNGKVVIDDVPSGVKAKNLGYNTYDYIV